MIKKLNWVFLALVIIVALGTFKFWNWNGGEQKATNGALVEVSIPKLSADATRGEDAFNSYCSSCHGVNGAGKDGVAPPLIHKIYEPSHHGDIAFVNAARNAVRQHHWPFGNMPPIERVTDEELSLIIVYVREIQRANGIN